jgi:hypothetical protein
MIIDRFEGPYRFLSNFYLAPVMYEGLLYTNNEAAFQSAKTKNMILRTPFTLMKPSNAKALGRSLYLRDDWEVIKDQIMFVICKDKFTRNKELKELLLKTGNSILIEGNWWGDTYWGMSHGVGKNKLGEILMEIRNTIL